MKSKVDWRDIGESVWSDKWEAVVGIVGLVISAVAGLPWWAAAIALFFAAVLAIDVVRTIRKTFRLAREKHIPLVVIVGRDRAQAKAVVSEALAVTDKLGFDPKQYLRDFGVEQDDWVLHREETLANTATVWMELSRHLLQRVQRLERLKGKKVFHVFLNCPAALAMGIGASLGTRHLLVIHHWQPGETDSAYVPVIDFSVPGMDGQAGMLRLKTRVSSSRECITLDYPDSLAGEVFVALQLSRLSPEPRFSEMALERDASCIVIRNCFGDVLPLDADWIQIAREVADALAEILGKPEVRRIHLAFSCPLPIAFAIGMALGVQAPVTIYNWYADRSEYVSVIELDKMRRLAKS